MRSGALGDSVLTLPAAAALRRGFGDLAIHLVFPRMMAEIAGSDLFTDVGGTAVTSLYDPASDIPQTTRATFADSRFLLVYSSRGDGIRSRLQQLVGGDVVLWDPRPPARFSQHITRHLSQPLRELGIPVDDWDPRITIPPEQRIHLEKAPGGDRTAISDLRKSRGLVAVHPGSGGVQKCWPLQKFAMLVDELLRAGIRVVVLLGPVEAERQLDILRLDAPGAHTLWPGTVAHLAAVLERVDLFVGNDSGPGHLAAAVGTPTLSLFGPTDPAVWRPPGPKAAVIASEDHDIASIPVGTVVHKVLDKLEEI